MRSKFISLLFFLFLAATLSIAGMVATATLIFNRGTVGNLFHVTGEMLAPDQGDTQSTAQTLPAPAFEGTWEPAGGEIDQHYQLHIATMRTNGSGANATGRFVIFFTGSSGQMMGKPSIAELVNGSLLESPNGYRYEYDPNTGILHLRINGKWVSDHRKSSYDPWEGSYPGVPSILNLNG